MTTFEVYLSIGAVASAIAVSLYVRHLVQTSGRDRPHDPEAVRRFIEKVAQLSAEQDENCRDGGARAEHGK